MSAAPRLRRAHARLEVRVDLSVEMEPQLVAELGVFSSRPDPRAQQHDQGSIDVLHSPLMAGVGEPRDRIGGVQPDELVIGFSRRRLPDDDRFDEHALLLDSGVSRGRVDDLGGAPDDPAWLDHQAALFFRFSFDRAFDGLVGFDPAARKKPAPGCPDDGDSAMLISQDRVRAWSDGVATSFEADAEHR